MVDKVDETTKVDVEEKKKLTQAEFEKKVLELSKEGISAEIIGERLRREGVHSKEYSKKISHILGKDYVSPDLKNVERKLEKIKEHYESNKQDKRAKREKDRVFSQLRKLKKYHRVE